MRLAALVVLAAVGTAHADDAPSAFDEGRALLAEGKAAEACEKFAAVLAAEPEAWGAMLNLGLCSEQLDKLATALRWFRRAQNRASELDNPDYEHAAKDKAISLAGKVATVRIHLTHAAPPGAFVAIDGSRVEPTDYTRVELDAGRHSIELHGATIPAQMIEIADGDHQTIEILVPVAEPIRRMELVDTGRTRRRVAYAFVAGAALLYGASATIAVVGKSRYENATRPAEWNAARDLVRWGGTSTFVAATGALAAAIYLYVSAPRPHAIEVVVPAGGGAAVSIGGAF
jgi:hypothetical protein